MSIRIFVITTHIFRVIEGNLTCVYTKDWCDVEDVKRVLYCLRELGVGGWINWKADEQTRNYERGSVYQSNEGQEFRISSFGREFLSRTPEGRKVLAEYS